MVPPFIIYMKESHTIIIIIVAIFAIFGLEVWIEELTGYNYHATAIFAIIVTAKYIWRWHEKSNDKVVIDKDKIDDEILLSIYQTLNLKDEGVKTYDEFKKNIIQDEDGLRYCYNKLIKMGLDVTRFSTASYSDFKLRIMGINKYKK